MAEKMVPEKMVPEKMVPEKMVPVICETYAKTNYLRKEPKSTEMKGFSEK